MSEENYEFYEGKEPTINKNGKFTDPYFKINDESVFGKINENWNEEKKENIINLKKNIKKKF